MNKKWFALSLAAVVSITTLTACTDNTKIKQEVDQALAKQNEIKSSVYSGSLTVNLGDGLLSVSNPLMSGLLGMAKESKLDWNGAVNKEPLQLETDLTFTPKGSSSSTLIPVLIKDSKLYFNMPAINKPDEFYSVDLQEMSKDSKSPLNADSLKNTSQITTELAKMLTGGIDAKWYKTAKEPVQLKDGTSAHSISIEISTKNEKELNAYVQSKLPEFIQTLQTNGLLNAAEADKFKNGSAKSLKFDAPGMLTYAIDDQGFIRDQVMDISFSIMNAAGKTVSSKINLHQAVDSINQPPAFKKEIPKNVKNFNDVLKLLGTAPAAK